MKPSRHASYLVRADSNGADTIGLMEFDDDGHPGESWQGADLVEGLQAAPA